MKIFYSIMTIASLLAMLFSCSVASTPQPAVVPKKAEWAGGPDGGAWILCNRISKEPWGPLFECTIYDDYKGSVLARGLYVISTKQNEKFRRIHRFEGSPHYAYFDGHVIGLQRYNLFMVPHGIIDYPFPTGGGKRITYDHGLQIGPEQSY